MRAGELNAGCMCVQAKRLLCKVTLDPAMEWSGASDRMHLPWSWSTGTHSSPAHEFLWYGVK
jgi:hypothetical protein